MVKLTEEDLKVLNQKVFQKKMEELFEEPSAYEDEEEDV
jgi:hypothetical protein